MSPKFTSYTMVLTVYNEESRIRRTIEYYRPFADLVVVDNFSKDGTVSILEELGVNYVRYDNKGAVQTPECINYLLSLSKTDYVMLLSCSEFFPPKLMAKFDRIASEGKFALVSTVRRSYTCGEFIPLWGGKFGIEARVERFFRKDGISTEKVRIHGAFTPKDPDTVLRLPPEPGLIVTHLRDADAVSLASKSVAYAAIEAAQRSASGRRLTLFGLAGLFMKEAARFLQLPASNWGMLALREIWARLLMHTAIYFIGWELEAGRGMAFSQKGSSALWEKLSSGKDGGA